MRWKEDIGLESILCSMMLISTGFILLAEIVLFAFGTVKISRSHIHYPWNITQIGSMILSFAVEGKTVSAFKYKMENRNTHTVTEEINFQTSLLSIMELF
jgi:hypothetical protein